MDMRQTLFTLSTASIVMVLAIFVLQISPAGANLLMVGGVLFALGLSALLKSYLQRAQGRPNSIPAAVQAVEHFQQKMPN
jgi:hypothetical protein